MNQYNAIGRIGKDPEFKEINGLEIVNFSIAINETWKNQDGEKQEKTHWIDCKCFGKRASVIADYFGKGDRIGITGKLNHETWENKDGEKRSRIVANVTDFDFVDSKQAEQSAPQQPEKPEPFYDEHKNGPNDDLPF